MKKNIAEILNINFEPVKVEMFRYWWLPVYTLILTLGATWVFSSQQPRIYRATTSIVVVPKSEIMNPREVTEALNTLERRSIIATLAKSPTTGALKKRLETEFSQVSDYSISAIVVPDTNILEISVEGNDPSMAIAIANATAGQTVIYMESFYNIFLLKILDPATTAFLVSPIYTRNMIVGGIFGLAAGFAFSFLTAYVSVALYNRNKIPLTINLQS